MLLKKEKNRKAIRQNFRNKVQNRRYTSVIKFLFKMIKQKLFFVKKKAEKSTAEKIEILAIYKKLESLLDKAVKKKIIHKNTSARKKSKISTLLTYELR